MRQFLIPIAIMTFATAACAAELQISLPLNRTIFQTNELIDATVVRSDAKALGAADLKLTLSGNDNSTIEFVLPLKAIDGLKTTEHVRINARLLRPAKYTLTAEAYGATAKTSFELASHVRR